MLHKFVPAPLSDCFLGDLAKPWPWHDCLETLRLITKRLDQCEQD